MIEIVNSQKQTNIKISNAITKTEFAKEQKQLPAQWSKSICRPYHFVANCEYDYVTDKKLKGLIPEIIQNKPYFVNNEIGTIAYDEKGDVDPVQHWHLFFYSNKSINTIKKKLIKIGFMNLRYSDPKNKKYDKYKLSKDIEPCIIYLSKGATNHMKSTDNENVAPIVRLTNLTIMERLGYRLRYLAIIRDMKQKEKDFKKNIKQKHKTDTEQVLAYMEGKTPSEIADALPQFFLENLTIKDSDFKYNNYFLICLKKYHPEVYIDYRRMQMRKKFEEII